MLGWSYLADLPFLLLICCNDECNGACCLVVDVDDDCDGGVVYLI